MNCFILQMLSRQDTRPSNVLRIGSQNNQQTRVGMNTQNMAPQRTIQSRLRSVLQQASRLRALAARAQQAQQQRLSHSGNIRNSGSVSSANTVTNSPRLSLNMQRGGGISLNARLGGSNIHLSSRRNNDNLKQTAPRQIQRSIQRSQSDPTKQVSRDRLRTLINILRNSKAIQDQSHSNIFAHNDGHHGSHVIDQHGINGQVTHNHVDNGAIDHHSQNQQQSPSDRGMWNFISGQTQSAPSFQILPQGGQTTQNMGNEIQTFSSRTSGRNTNTGQSIIRPPGQQTAFGHQLGGNLDLQLKLNTNTGASRTVKLSRNSASNVLNTGDNISGNSQQNGLFGSGVTNSIKVLGMKTVTLPNGQKKMSVTLMSSHTGGRPVVVEALGKIVLSQEQMLDGRIRFIVKADPPAVDPAAEVEVEAEEMTTTTASPNPVTAPGNQGTARQILQTLIEHSPLIQQHNQHQQHQQLGQTQSTGASNQNVITLSSSGRGSMLIEGGGKQTVFGASQGYTPSKLIIMGPSVNSGNIQTGNTVDAPSNTHSQTSNTFTASENSNTQTSNNFASPRDPKTQTGNNFALASNSNTQTSNTFGTAGNSNFQPSNTFVIRNNQNQQSNNVLANKPVVNYITRSFNQPLPEATVHNAASGVANSHRNNGQVASPSASQIVSPNNSNASLTPTASGSSKQTSGSFIIVQGPSKSTTNPVQSTNKATAKTTLLDKTTVAPLVAQTTMEGMMTTAMMTEAP